MPIAAAFVTTVTVLFFQNCGSKSLESVVAQRASQMADEAAVDGANNSLRDLASTGELRDPLTSCLFNGQEVPDGSDVIAYQNGSVADAKSCVSQVRKCIKGGLSGSFQFADCVVSSKPACLFNGVTLQSGESIKGYKEVLGSGGQKSCSEKILTCNSGNLPDSANYPLATCTPAIAKKSCLFDGTQVVHGSQIKGYTVSTVGDAQNCKSLNMACNDGVIAGADVYSFSSCPLGNSFALPADGEVASSAVKSRICKRVSEGQAASLSCPAGSVIESVNFANYGTSTGDCGSYKANSKCSASTALNLTKSVCEGNKGCQILASNEVFQDPCVGTGKNLAIQVTCSTAKPAVTSGASCSFNKKTVAHGQSIAVFKISAGNCPIAGSGSDAPLVTCKNGKLSSNSLPFRLADYSFDSCTQTCALQNANGKTQTYSNGKKVTAYQNNLGNCSVQKTLTCSGNKWSAADASGYIYNSCTNYSYPSYPSGSESVYGESSSESDSSSSYSGGGSSGGGTSGGSSSGGSSSGGSSSGSSSGSSNGGSSSSLSDVWMSGY